MHGYSPCLSSNGGTDGEIEHEDGWCDLTLSPFWGVFFPFFGLAFSFLFRPVSCFYFLSIQSFFLIDNHG